MPQAMDFSVYFQVLLFSILTGLFVYLLGFILRYKSKNTPQNPNGASDLEVSENSEKQYSVNFLNYCICFLLLEAACVLMFPFAYINGLLDIFHCAEIMIFILILIIILLFCIKSGLLNISKD